MLHARQVPVPAPVVKVKIRFARVMSRIPSGRLGTNTHAPLEVVLTVVGITRRNAFEFATIMTVTIEADVIMILTSGTVATAIGVILISGVVLVLNLHPVVAIVDSRSRKTPLARHLVPNVGVLTRTSQRARRILRAS
ncbi:hypothetical protein QR680_000912 [Steinernema hermaphroditum]|uniref:Uncharacterized protein n=1 Tax=Steinernema hermaphroditum TaxID=289476 RepID=A0AA39GX60_9BILA|nr:hypothetical protein QR680_000912 [Steinernema hermaphroditum]